MKDNLLESFQYLVVFGKIPDNSLEFARWHLDHCGVVGLGDSKMLLQRGFEMPRVKVQSDSLFSVWQKFHISPKLSHAH